MFSSKRKLSSQQVTDVLSVSKDEVKSKLAELSDVTRHAESSFKEASALSKALVKQLTKKPPKKKPGLQIAS